MLSINNVSYMDTRAFADEVRLVIERDYERVWNALTEYVTLEGDTYKDDDVRPYRETVRRPLDVDARRVRHAGGRKHKEVK
jgi:hypothetical protein